jgi:hypothetical protein
MIQPGEYLVPLDVFALPAAPPAALAPWALNGVERHPAPALRPQSEAEILLNIGQGLRELSTAVKEFPGYVVAQAGIVKAAYVEGAAHGGAGGFVLGVLIAALICRVKRG